MCLSLNVIQFVELVSVDSRDEDNWKGQRLGRWRRQKEDVKNDEDNDELLTLYQVHLDPVSTEQVAKLSEKRLVPQYVVRSRLFIWFF